MFKNQHQVIQKINNTHKLCSIRQQKQIQFRFNNFSKCKYLFNGKFLHTFLVFSYWYFALNFDVFCILLPLYLAFKK